LVLMVGSVYGSALDLGAMVATSGLCFTAKLWKNYGCYCGLGHCAKEQPVDCLDSCCAAHDQCYSATPFQSDISREEVLFMKYSWRRTKSNRIICQDCQKGGNVNVTRSWHFV